MIDQREVAAGSPPATGAVASRRGRRRRPWEWIAAAAVLASGLGIVVFVLSRGNDTSRAVPSGAATTVSEGAPAPPAASSGALATAPVPTTSAVRPATSATSATSAVQPPGTAATPPPNAPATVVPAGSPVRWAVFDHGKVFLRGRVPDQATADLIVAKAAKVVGPPNVTDQYTIDPGAARPDSAPLYVADTVLFDTGSAVLRPEFTGLLDLGTVLLKQNPKVTITVIGHTDNVGDPQSNLALSQRRVAAAIGYVVDRGVDPSRLIGVAKGDTDPVGDNSTPEGRRANRRVEFVITGFLD